MRVINRFWLKSYPAGVPDEIDPGQYDSLVHLLEEAFSRYRDRRAYVGFGRAMTYAELDERSRAFAAFLQAEGIARGDRVAIMMPNLLQYPVALAAVLRLGAIVVNVNPLYTPRELEFQLKDSGAKAIVILENFATTLEHAIAHTEVKKVIVATMGDLLGFKGTMVNFVVRKVKKLVPAFHLPGAVGFNEALAAGQTLSFQAPTLQHADVAFLQYTGGTTGISKGATLSHRNVISNVLQSEAWMQPALNKPGKSSLDTEQLVSVCALPLYHIFALTVCALLGMRVGALNILIPNPRDLEALVKELRPYRFHVFPAVNTLYNALAEHPGFRKLDFSALRVSNGGGMAVQRATAERWLELTSCPICEGYGLSETSP